MDPDKYRYIRAWGIMLGSYEYYIQHQQMNAAKENAPINVVYHDGTRWITVDECCASTQQQVRAIERRI